MRVSFRSSSRSSSTCSRGSKACGGTSRPSGSAAAGERASAPASRSSRPTAGSRDGASASSSASSSTSPRERDLQRKARARSGVYPRLARRLHERRQVHAAQRVSPAPACSSTTSCSRRSTPRPAASSCPRGARSRSPTPSGSSTSSRTDSSRRSSRRSTRSGRPTCSSTSPTRRTLSASPDAGGPRGALRDRRLGQAARARLQQGGRCSTPTRAARRSRRGTRARSSSRRSPGRACDAPRTGSPRRRRAASVTLTVLVPYTRGDLVQLAHERGPDPLGATTPRTGRGSWCALPAELASRASRSSRRRRTGEPYRNSRMRRTCSRPEHERCLTSAVSAPTCLPGKHVEVDRRHVVKCDATSWARSRDATASRARRRQRTRASSPRSGLRTSPRRRALAARFGRRGRLTRPAGVSAPERRCARHPHRAPRAPPRRASERSASFYSDGWGASDVDRDDGMRRPPTDRPSPRRDGTARRPCRGRSRRASRWAPSSGSRAGA